MTLIPVPYALKDAFKKKFFCKWVHERRMWKIRQPDLRAAQAWIAREQAKLAQKTPAG